ncbi:glucosamine-6-phosphate deaminase [Candidatus Enterococcus ikei]|uniref:Glucosamine-6-phosphate deaminase n=1 Tax=Candidatus Enterococcus ikei TaxID=2815326 RepID=A0ABS3GU49_9ENTE|nr:glucosamine-6-phosphate deaminase [Enterococcus sp. DIV0869a]MBO0438787.1 glucosamine-6-phosphate deaminase [Enterococcus sp. DIV0869a]
MKVIVVKDYDELSKVAAQMLIGEMFQRHERVNLAITAGTTPIGMYEKLVDEVKGKSYFDNVHYYNFDEIPYKSGCREGVTIGDLRELYFTPAEISEERIHILDGENYEEQDKRVAEAGGLDAILLGIGADGHYCGNLPGTTKFTDFTTKVVCDEAMKERIAPHFENRAETPDFYVTMGPRSVMNARHLILFASGKKKAKIMKAFVEGAITDEIPASILKLHPHLTVILDEEAAQFL